MPISSYPRVTVQGTSNAQNAQNGSSLMIFNPSTNKYEAVTAATLGGGDATAANQTIQIGEAQGTNTYLSNIELNTLDAANSLKDGGSSAAQILNNILTEINNLATILTNGDTRVVITDTSGNVADVDSTKKALNINDVT
jgi:hypothetical protein